MEQNFNIQRFLNVLKWDFSTYTKRHIKDRVLIPIFGLALMCIVIQLVDLGNIRAYSAAEYESDYIWTIASFTLLITLLFFVIGQSTIFDGLNRKAPRQSYLTLPASNIEKYLSRLAVTTIGHLVYIMIVFIIVDIIQYLFAQIISPGHGGSLLYGIYKIVFCIPEVTINPGFNTPKAYFAFAIFLASGYLINCAFYTFTGSIFNRHIILLSLISNFVVITVLSTVLNFIIPINIQYTSDLTTEVWDIVIVLSILQIVISGMLYFLSYKIFTRLQIVTRGFLNV